MSLTIEEFTPTYQNQVKDFILEMWKEFDFPYVPEEDADLDDIQGHYHDNGGIFYILRDGDEVKGTIGILKHSKEIAELVRLYVDKSQQGNGFGSQLVDKAISFCTNRGFKKIELNTNKIFEKAHLLYQRKGFKVTREDSQDYYMEKLLG